MKAYDSLTEIQRQLLARNIIDIVGDIEGAAVKYVRESIIRAQARSDKCPELTFFISSSGGSVGAGLDIYDLIRNYPGKTTGRAMCYANSMAAIILQACDIRQCCENVGILIHNPNRENVSWDDLVNPKRLKKIIESLDKSRQRIFDIWSSRSGLSFKRIAAICAKDKSLSAEEALKLNLIDEIITKPVKEKPNA